MVDVIGPADAVTGAPAFSGRKQRQLNSALLTGATAARPLGSVTGVRPGTPSNTVTATSTTWTVQPFAGIADVESSAIAGPYQFAFDAVATGSVTAANASNPRVDIVYVQIDDPAESDGSSVPAVTRKYLAGTAAASPVAPALPVARAFVIANINVPISGGGSPTVTWTAPLAVAAGGILPVASSASYPASPYVGQQVDDASLGYTLRYAGSLWQPEGSGLNLVYPTSVAGSGVTLSSGLVTFSAATAISVNGCFTSQYTNYRVVVDISAQSGSAGGSLRLRAAGTDDSSTNYTVQHGWFSGSSTPSAATASGQTSWGTTPVSGAEHFYVMEFNGPAVARATRLQIHDSAWATPTTGVDTTTSARHTLTTAYDGFTYTPSAGNVTGTVTVYGYYKS